MGETTTSSQLSGGYLLVVLAEPHNEQHKEILLQRLAKGLASWDSPGTGIDIEAELRNIAAQCPQGEELRNGEKLVQLASDSLVTEILIHPQLSTLKQCMRNLLASFTRHRHVVHAGYTLSGSGSWIVQDGMYELTDFLGVLQDPEVQALYKAYGSITTDLHAAPEGQWSPEKFHQEPAIKSAKISINPGERWSPDNESVSSFIRYVSDIVPAVTLDHLLEPSDVVGNIRFSHPTLYVFPGGQGDSALFGISGFNILVDGGFGRKPCFWDFTRHLDRLDAVVMTRNNPSSLSGLTGAICRKASSPVYPQIGHVFCNLPDFNEVDDVRSSSEDPLTIHLTDLCRAMSAGLDALQLKAQPVYRTASLQPINLYHKVGHGTLDMYVITPSSGNADVKELVRLWRAGGEAAGVAQRTVKLGGKEIRIPLLDMVSVCALLVWHPADPSESVTRLLFPGSAPQQKILEGLDKLKEQLECLKAPVCLAKNLSSSTAGPKSPVKAKQQQPPHASLSSPRHVTPAASEPLVKAIRKEKPLKSTENNREADSNKSAAARPAAKSSSAEAKTKAADSAGLNSSRAGSVELRMKKAEAPKSVASSKPAVPVPPKVKKDAANLKMVEAKVQSFKSPASSKENNKTGAATRKIISPESEKGSTVAARSQSQTREKRSASTARSAGPDSNKTIKKSELPGSPARAPLISSAATKPALPKVNKTAMKEKPLEKKERPKSAAPPSASKAKDLKTSNKPTPPQSSSTPPSAKAVKRPVKMAGTAAAVVATTAATVAVAIPHDDEHPDEGKPVEEVVFGTAEAPQAASSPKNEPDGGEEEEPAAAEEARDVASIVASLEDQILQAEEEADEQPAEEKEEEESSLAEDGEAPELAEIAAAEANEEEEMETGDVAAAGEAEEEKADEESEGNKEEEEVSHEPEEEEEAEVNNEITDAPEDVMDRHEPESGNQGATDEPTVYPVTSQEEEEQVESAEPQLGQIERDEDSHTPAGGDEESQQEEQEAESAESNVIHQQEISHPPLDVVESAISQSEAAPPADDDQIDAEEDNASANGDDEGFPAAGSIDADDQVPDHVLERPEQKADEEEEPQEESHDQDVCPDEEEEEGRIESSQQEPGDFQFSATSAPALSEKYPQGKDPMEKNTPCVVVSLDDISGPSSSEVTEEFVVEIIQKPVVVPDPELVSSPTTKPKSPVKDETVRPSSPRVVQQQDDDNDSAEEVEEETFQQEIKTKDSAVPITPTDDKAPPQSRDEEESEKKKSEQKGLVVALPKEADEEPAKKSETTKQFAEPPKELDDVSSIDEQAVLVHTEVPAPADEPAEEEDRVEEEPDDEEDEGVAVEETQTSKSDLKQVEASAYSTEEEEILIPPKKEIAGVIPHIDSALSSGVKEIFPMKDELMKMVGKTIISPIKIPATTTYQTEVESSSSKDPMDSPTTFKGESSKEEMEEEVPAILAPKPQFVAPITASTPIDGPEVISEVEILQTPATPVETTSSSNRVVEMAQVETIEGKQDEDIEETTTIPVRKEALELNNKEETEEILVETTRCQVVDDDHVSAFAPFSQEPSKEGQEPSALPSTEEIPQSPLDPSSSSQKEDETLQMEEELQGTRYDAKEVESIKPVTALELEEEEDVVSAIKEIGSIKANVAQDFSAKVIEESIPPTASIVMEKEEAVKVLQDIEEAPRSPPASAKDESNHPEPVALKVDEQLELHSTPDPAAILLTETPARSIPDVNLMVAPPSSVKSLVDEADAISESGQLKPDDALESGPSSASITPNAPLSPNVIHRKIDEVERMMDEPAYDNKDEPSSFESDIRSTSSSSSLVEKPMPEPDLKSEPSSLESDARSASSSLVAAEKTVPEPDTKIQPSSDVRFTLEEPEMTKDSLSSLDSDARSTSSSLSDKPTIDDSADTKTQQSSYEVEVHSAPFSSLVEKPTERLVEPDIKSQPSSLESDAHSASSSSIAEKMKHPEPDNISQPSSLKSEEQHEPDTKAQMSSLESDAHSMSPSSSSFAEKTNEPEPDTKGQPSSLEVDVHSTLEKHEPDNKVQTSNLESEVQSVFSFSSSAEKTVMFEQEAKVQLPSLEKDEVRSTSSLVPELETQQSQPSSIENDARSTSPSSMVEKELDYHQDDLVAPSASSLVTTSYLSGYEGVTVGVSNLSTISSSGSDAEASSQQYPSMDSNFSSKTYEKLSSSKAPQPEESAFSSGPSSWDVERESEPAHAQQMLDDNMSDRSATSSISSSQPKVESLNVEKRELLDPVSPVPSSSSHGDSEANKDSLSSIQTSGSSSDYPLESKVDDSASSAHSSDYSDQLHPHQQRAVSPRSDISSASETTTTSTTLQYIQPVTEQSAVEVKAGKVELEDPKVAPHNLWLKEKDQSSSPNPFTDRYEEPEHVVEPLAEYYGQQSDDSSVDDRQSDHSLVQVAEYSSTEEAHQDTEEGYLYEPEQDDNYQGDDTYGTQYGDQYHGDHQNGNSYHYYESSTEGTHQTDAADYDEDLNRNDRTPSIDQQQQFSFSTSSSQQVSEPASMTAAPSPAPVPAPQQQPHEETLASWGKPLNLPMAPPVNGVIEGTKKAGNVPSSPLRRSANGKSNGPETHYYVDLAYIPHHGDPRYSDVEFFRRIRARHYVLSTMEPSVQVLDALLEGKQSWTGEDKDLDVTIIPTYDSEALAVWVNANEDLLARNRIDLAPSASRCTINLQDHDTSCSAYRLEF